MGRKKSKHTILVADKVYIKKSGRSDAWHKVATIKKDEPIAKIEPKIGKFPTEVFGQVYCDGSGEARKKIHAQYCPFLDSECKKPRKSEPHIKVGTCSVGYKGSFTDKYIPVIICPHRLDTPEVFQTIQEQFFSDWKNTAYAKEVGMGVGGSVDFVAYQTTKEKITDFVCIEFQAGGTTGTPWQAVQELKQYGHYKQDSYDYGINWANEFVKTMMQQVYKKGKLATFWKKSIIFVVQDIAIDYIRGACDTSGLKEYNKESYIHFCTFSMKWEKDRWMLIFKEKISSDIDGINKILSGAHQDEYFSVEDFISNIESKLLRDK